MVKPKRPGRWGGNSKDQRVDDNVAADPRTVIGATIVSMEAHLRRSKMYKITLELEFETDEDDPELGGYRDKRNTSPEQANEEDKSGSWHDEVDALIVSAQTATEPGEATLTIHEDTLVGWRLLKGRRFTGEEYRLLLEEERKEEAYRDALAMLERKARTTTELSRALKRKGYAQEAVSGAIDRLRANRMVDDSAFAKRFAEQRATNQRKGRMLIRQELLQRGVGRPDIDEAIEQIEPEVEQQSALALARKKWPTTGSERERKMKVMAMLMRRGYTGSVVKSAVQQAASEAGDDRDEDDAEWNEYDESMD
ncbi:regulatory protein RecX [Cohnella sp. GCM10027633]|uniref:regulatory protein RecX n=1 Tax=unclassified Cohnella TaxID=2636738 RepID=UPI0036286F52